MAADFQIGAEIRGRERVSAAFKKVAGVVRGPVRRAFMAAGKAAGRLGKRVASATMKIAKIGVVAAAAAGAGIFRMVSGVAEAGDELAKASRRLGITAQAYAELQHAAELSGVEQTEFAKGLETFNKILGMTKAGTGPLVGLLKKASPPLLEQLRATENNTEAIELMLVAMAQLEDPSRRAALGAAAFGRAGQKMTLLTEGGIEAIDKQRAAFRRYAGVISDEGLKASEDFIDAQTNVKLAAKGVGFSLTKDLLPAITPVLTKLADWISANRELVSTKISEWVSGLASWIASVDWTNVLDGVGKFFKGVGKVLETLWDIKEVLLVGIGALALGKVVSMIGKAVMAAKAMFGWFAKSKTAAVATAAAGAVPAARGGVGAAIGGRGKAMVAAAAVPAIGATVLVASELENAIGSFPMEIKEALAGFERMLAGARAFGVDVEGVTAEDLFRDEDLRAAIGARLGIAAAGGTQQQVEGGLGFASTSVADQVLATQKMILGRIFEVERGGAGDRGAGAGEMERRQQALQETVATIGPAAVQQSSAVNDTLGRLNRTLERMERNPPKAQVAVTVAAKPGTSASVVPPGGGGVAAAVPPTGAPAVRATP